MPRIKSNNQSTPNDERTLDTSDERNPADVHVGSRIRLLRISARMSAEELSAALGVTIEKMHAFENGAIRIGPSLLYEVSKLLKCSPTAFFEGLN
jgi:DNA-binding XRE family transcriptional regulator